MHYIWALPFLWPKDMVNAWNVLKNNTYGRFKDTINEVRIKENFEKFQELYIDGKVTNPEQLSMAPRLFERGETGCELRHKWLNVDLPHNPHHWVCTDYFVEEFKEATVHMTKLENLPPGECITEMKTSSWKAAQEKARAIGTILDTIKDLPEEKKLENDAEKIKDVLADIWQVYHPSQHFDRPLKDKKKKE